MGVRILRYLIIVWAVCIRITDAQLSENFYSKTCPNVEGLVLAVARQKLAEAPVSAPATIRLLFHDCFVDGCDASVLISSTPKYLAERDADDNKNLAVDAFDAVNQAKAAVEAKCPGVVSCADILAIAARDFIALTGGPNYPVKKGRKDGRTSLASRVRGNLPEPTFNVDLLLKTFGSKGLNRSDMVALSGAHTIGFSHCDGFLDRLYNYRRTNLADPSMDPRLLKALKMSCPKTGGNADIITPFDVNTPFAFDNAYYKNLELKMGLLGTDQALFSDPRTKYLVQYFANYRTQFFQAFSLAMDKMSSIGVKTGNQGEIRKVCTQVNV
jgi:peroxidase